MKLQYLTTEIWHWLFLLYADGSNEVSWYCFRATWTRYFPCKCSAHPPDFLALGKDSTSVRLHRPRTPLGVPATFFSPSSARLPCSPQTHSLQGNSRRHSPVKPCAAGIHLQDPPPRKLLPRHQLPQEAIPSSAGLLAPPQRLTGLNSQPVLLKSRLRLSSIFVKDGIFCLCSDRKSVV